MANDLDDQRQYLVNEAARIANNIDQLLIDVESWNNAHPDEDPIDGDPDGNLAAKRNALLAFLEVEALCGNVPSKLPQKAAPRRYVPLLVETEDLPIAE